MATAAVLMLVTLGACASDSDTSSAVVEETTAATPDPEREPTEETTDEPEVEPVAGEDADTSSEDTFIMPNVVGMNLQEAQDELQSLGSYILSQDDATGQGRFQVLDSNWQVCSQDQAPGETFDLAELVNLTAVKLSETCP
jgi:hypothetical protein